MGAKTQYANEDDDFIKKLADNDQEDLSSCDDKDETALLKSVIAPSAIRRKSSKPIVESGNTLSSVERSRRNI